MWSSIAKSEPSAVACAGEVGAACCCMSMPAPPKMANQTRLTTTRHQQHAGDELADGAAARDAGDEHADEGRPRRPTRPSRRSSSRRATSAWRRRPRRRCAPTSSPGRRSSCRPRSGTRLRMKTVGPTTKTNTASTTASTMLMFDSHWMPLATPETAERMKQTVRMTMMRDEHAVADLAEPGDDLQAGADLQRAEAERGRRAEERREDREDVDDPARGAVGAPLAEQRARRRS